MLLLLLSGAGKSGPAPAPPSKLIATNCCFQGRAFQGNAFQNCGGPIGWWPEWGFQHDPEELERRLAAQKSERKWFDEFVAASLAAKQRAELASGEKHRNALISAVGAAADKVAIAIKQEREPPVYMVAALQAAASASRITASIRHAESVIEMAREWEDEEDILMLLQ